MPSPGPGTEALTRTTCPHQREASWLQHLPSLACWTHGVPPLNAASDPTLHSSLCPRVVGRARGDRGSGSSLSTIKAAYICVAAVIVICVAVLYGICARKAFEGMLSPAGLVRASASSGARFSSGRLARDQTPRRSLRSLGTQSQPCPGNLFPNYP